MMSYKNFLKILILLFIFIIPMKAFSYDMLLNDSDFNNEALIRNQANLAKQAKEKADGKNKKNNAQTTDNTPTPEQTSQPTANSSNEKALIAPQKTTDIEVYSQYLQYYPERNEFEATGDAHIYIPKEKSTLWADRLVFNRDTNVVKGYGNVKINKLSYDATGDYVQINLNEKNALLEDPIVEEYNVKIVAKDSNFYPGKLTAQSGTITGKDDIPLVLGSTTFGNYFDPSMPTINQANFSKENLHSEDFKLKAKEIVVKSLGEHDELTLKGVDIYYKKLRVATAPSIKFVTNKAQQYVEANTPEISSLKDFGLFFGPGYVFNLPKGAALKVAPVAVYSSGDWGIGGIARFRSGSNTTEAAWGSVKKEWIVRGRQELFSKNLWLDYAYNAYIDEWFFGDRRPGRFIQLTYGKKYPLLSGMAYEHRLSAGYMTDPHEQWGTSRFRYQGQFSHLVYSRVNSEKKTALYAGYGADATMMVYGNGDTQGVLRGGPWVRTEYKNWVSHISYSLGAHHGESPFDFDKYMYGSHSVSFIEMLRLSKYLSVAYSATLALARDNVDNSMLQENKFFLVMGPEDFKLNVGYDTVRQRSVVNFQIVVGGTGQDNNIDFKKLIVHDPDRLGQKDEKSQKFDQMKLKFMKVFAPDDAEKFEKEINSQL